MADQMYVGTGEMICRGWAKPWGLPARNEPAGERLSCSLTEGVGNAIGEDDHPGGAKELGVQAKTCWKRTKCC